MKSIDLFADECVLTVKELSKVKGGGNPPTSESEEEGSLLTIGTKKN